jgi:hypothetical protein
MLGSLLTAMQEANKRGFTVQLVCSNDTVHVRVGTAKLQRTKGVDLRSLSMNYEEPEKLLAQMIMACMEELQSRKDNTVDGTVIRGEEPGEWRR